MKKLYLCLLLLLPLLGQSQNYTVGTIPKSKLHSFDSYVFFDHIQLQTISKYQIMGDTSSYYFTVYEDMAICLNCEDVAIGIFNLDAEKLFAHICYGTEGVWMANPSLPWVDKESGMLKFVYLKDDNQ